MKEEVKLILIESIRVLNPRHRDQKRFQAIIQSIKNLGLKKPIKVSSVQLMKATIQVMTWLRAKEESRPALPLDTKKSPPLSWRYRKKIDYS